MLTFLRIERPTSATLRPSAAAASTTCCTRWMFEAKLVTTMRPSQRAKTSSRCGPDARLRRREARAVGVGRVAAQQQHAVAPELGQARDVGGLAVHGRLVELVVAGDQDRASSVVSATAQESGIEWVMWISSTPNGPELDGLARSPAPPAATSRQLVLVELGARHRHRQRAAVDDRDAVLAQLAQDPRQRAEVVLVAVRDDDRPRCRPRARAGRRSRAGRGRCRACRRVGKRRPTSTTTMRPSYSTTVMFLPISPSPPSGRTRRRAALTRSCAARSPWRSSTRADRGGLLFGRLDERQPQAADLVAEQVQRRLHGDRVRGRPHSAS